MKVSTVADMIFGRPVHTTSPDDSVRTACITMSAANIGALPVVDDHGDLVGIFSERDVIKRSVIVYRPSETTLVSQVMTRDPQWLSPDATPADAVRIMVKGRFRHLPICVDCRLVGIVSIRDFTTLTPPTADQPDVVFVGMDENLRKKTKLPIRKRRFF